MKTICHSPRNQRFRTVFLILIILLATGVLKAQSTFSAEVTGAGIPIILIPGLGCDGSVWKETVTRLQESGYACHVITLAGFAGKPAPDTTSIALIVSDLNRYIDALGRKPILIGHSLGGFIGLRLAIDHPSGLEKLVIVDALPFLPAAMNPSATVEMIRPQAAMMKTFTLNQPVNQFKASTQNSLRMMIADSASRSLAVEWAVRSNRRIFASMTDELMTTDLRQAVSGIRCPVLVLGAWAAAKPYGLTMETVKKTYESQYARLKGVTVEMAPNAYHFIMLDEPVWMMDRILPFLGGKRS